jgi:cholesterol oxidase
MDGREDEAKAARFDVVVVGSGFGGSVAALRLTEKGYRVAVLEAGRRWRAEDFPKTNWNLRRYLWFPRLGMRGIQRLRLLKNALVLSGSGVGGGSLVYAGVLYEPLEGFWRDPQWAGITDWKSELAPYYEVARRMLGVVRTPFETPADGVMKDLARHLGVPNSHHPTHVGIYFGAPGEGVADPYFGGQGPDRAGCLRCGGCMVGCRHNAKNSLDRNYLYLAERKGARVFPESQVVDVAPHHGAYRVTYQWPGAWIRKAARTMEADHVVFAAGVLGTLELLLRMKSLGRLPQLSQQLGNAVRTNSETIVGATAKDRAIDYSTGVAITSSIHPDAETHIEPCRYPKGSNLMGLLSTVLVGDGDRLPRPLRFAVEAARHPLVFFRSLSVYRWSERTIILLVMQSRRNTLRLRLTRGLLGPRLSSSHADGNDPEPTYVPMANEAARFAAEAIGGSPGSTINEVLLGIPVTAHILGGACIGNSAETGVIDPYHRVFGHPGLHVVDGSAISANLGANPSLTITAQAERAMAYWPNKGEPDPRPPMGAYERIEPVPATRPAVAALV